MKRDAFSSRIGFILAAAGAAIGLGNIWRFPYEVGKGGGAIFLVVYLIVCFAVCWPIMLSEVAMGRAAQKDAVGAYGVLGHRKWNFIGKIGVLVAVLVLSFYNVIAGWAFGYFLEIIQGHFSIGKHFEEAVNDIYRVNIYALCFMLMTAFIVSKGISGGIEKATRVLMPLLLFIILFLGIYAMTLPHAGKGLSFYLFPDFSELNLRVAYKAVGHALFSLSLGLSAMITYGSYLPKDNNIVQSTAAITLADVSIAFLAGFMIFPLVAFLNAGDMSNVQAGPSLIFVTLPEVFGSLGPVLGIVMGGTFFLLICFAALTSTISLLEIPVAYAVDELKVARRPATYFIALFIFLLGIPSAISFGDSTYYTKFISYIGTDKVHSFLGFVDAITEAGMTLGGCLVAIFVVHAWRNRHFAEQVALGNDRYKGSFLEKYVHFALSYLCPLLLGSMFLFRLLQEFFGLFQGW